MVIRKEIFEERHRNSNAEYLVKRWAAMCASNAIEDYFEAKRLRLDSFTDNFIEFQTWIEIRTSLRSYLIEKALTLQLHGALASVLEQTKLVWGYTGMKAAQVMHSYTRSGNAALTVASVAQQAVDFKQAYDASSSTLKQDFPYAQLKKVSGIETIHHRKYPDLYYAAVTAALQAKSLGVEGRFRMTDVETSVSKKVIDELIKESLDLELGMSTTAREHLKILGYTLREGEEPPLRRRRMT